MEKYEKICKETIKTVKFKKVRFLFFTLQENPLKSTWNEMKRNGGSCSVSDSNAYFLDFAFLVSFLWKIWIN